MKQKLKLLRILDKMVYNFYNFGMGVYFLTFLCGHNASNQSSLIIEYIFNMYIILKNHSTGKESFVRMIVLIAAIWCVRSVKFILHMSHNYECLSFVYLLAYNLNQMTDSFLKFSICKIPECNWHWVAFFSSVVHLRLVFITKMCP